VSAPIKTFFCPARRAPQVFTGGSWYGPPRTYGHAQTDYAARNLENTRIVRNRFNRILLTSLTHRTPHTMMVGENRLNLRFLGQFQGDDNEGYTAGWDHDVERYTNHQPLPDYSGNGDGAQRFGSSHPTGFQAVFADGAVHRISYSINLTIF